MFGDPFGRQFFSDTWRSTAAVLAINCKGLTIDRAAEEK